jgi:LuxR family transcriptional regulator, maltose regulon positive regulatory protein
MTLSPAIPLRAAARPPLRFAPRGPAFGPALVARPRLVRLLANARDVPLVLLAAPAGYGKTTTLLDWAQHDPRPFAWVALDAGHDDPATLLTSVARSSAAARERADAFVLVLDGLDALRSPEALDAVAGLVAHPPPRAQLVLACRGEPALALGRLRAHREVLEVTAGDLAMTHREAAALLERTGLALREAHVDALMQRTEGWPAGLYLAALALRDQGDDVDAAVARFAGDDRVVGDYVADSVLCDLTADQEAFLLRTSVLDRLGGPLCDAVLEERGCAAKLRDLERANVLLVALDRTGDWYRHHRLLGEALRAQLRRREPELVPELHRRAAGWHADRGEVDAAIRHAVAAGDVERAGDLLWAVAPGHLAAGRDAAVRGWLERLGADELARRPPLALVASHACLARGERDLAEHWAGEAARAVGEAPRAAAMRSGVDLARAAIARDGLERMRDEAASAGRFTGADSPWRSLELLLEGTARHLLGESDRARGLLAEGARRSVLAAPSINARCLAQLALLALDGDDRHDAAGLGVRARAQVERHGLGGQPSMSLVLSACALTRARVGQVDAATHDAAAAALLQRKLADCPEWHRAQVAIVLARALLALGDLCEAHALLDDDTLERAATDSPVLRAWLADALAQLACYSASVAAMPVSLTGAELRVLRLLPTHLSFREMGGRLYVSANTVKTQAQAVYRKLDASSRSEAVARARSLGLLEVMGEA